MDLIGPIHQALRANVGVPSRQGRIPGVAQGAVELDGRIHHLVHHIGEEHLGDAVFLPNIHLVLGLIGDVEQHETRDVELAGALRQHELHGLALIEALAKGAPLGDVGRRHIQGALGHGDVVHAVAKPPVGQAMLTHVEAVPLAAEEVFRGHLEILNFHLGVATPQDVGQGPFQGHGGDIPLNVVARVGQLHDEGGELLVARRVRVRLRHDHGDIGDARRGGEPFLPVQHVGVIVLLFRSGLHPRSIGAGGLFRHGVANALLTVQKGFEELFLLIGRAVFKKRHHRGIVRALRIHGQGAEIALPELHLHQGVGQRAQAHAAVLLGNEGTPEPLAPGLRAQLPEHGFVIVAVEQTLFCGYALVLHPLAHALPQTLGFRRNLKIYGHSILPLWCGVGRAPYAPPSLQPSRGARRTSLLLRG